MDTSSLYTIIVALGWVTAPPNIKGCEWYIPEHRIFVSPEHVYKMMSFPLEVIPQKMDYASWSLFTPEGYRCIICPFLSKRLELGI